MKHIVSLSMCPAKYNFEKEFQWEGETIRLGHFGCDFNLKIMEELISQFDGEVDGFAISGLPRACRIGKKILTSAGVQHIFSLPKKSFVVDGALFHDVYFPWTIRELLRTNPKLLDRKKIGLYSGIWQSSSLSIFQEYTARIYTIDPYLFLGIPVCLKNLGSLHQFGQKVAPFFHQLRFQRSYKVTKPLSLDVFSQLEHFKSCHVFVATEYLLDFVEIEFLKGKTLIVDALQTHMEKKLLDLGVKEIIVCSPNLFNLDYLNFAIAEAIFLAVKKGHGAINNEDLVTWIEEYQLRPRLQRAGPRLSSKEVSKFAFIIHPLSGNYFFKHKLLRPLSRWRQQLGAPLEFATSYLPGIKYGTIKGIVSAATGKEVQGDIYTLFETPKMMKEVPPEKIYEKLVNICERAEAEGAEIIGLGAYTKIVGDAGVTVNRLSPIPVTTGNSMSAVATLMAAKECLLRMNLATFDDQKRMVVGKVMVVGATGSIGSVLARVLARFFTEVVLVAPRPYKLLELKATIEGDFPSCKVISTTRPDKYSGKCDLIITTTSSAGEKILDITKVRPGCVICDVSRPFDISKEEALLRPDVLVVANGEVELPGLVKIDCDLGLPNNVVYACLAETALLALEGRLESFTLSREISLDNLRDIYRMAMKHGVKLAEITGPLGVVTEAEIKLARSHALLQRGALHAEQAV